MLNPTEFEFILPRGLVDTNGQCHRQGIMRLATARDEFERSRNRQAQENPIWSDLVILARVITQLGEFAQVTPDQLAELFSADLGFLRELFNRLNRQDHAQLEAQCPHCRTDIEINLALSGESWATPQMSSMER